jgi:CRISPR/Cas system CMR subunit Cmr6 (Cas7 group RAMP superfamily)
MTYDEYWFGDPWMARAYAQSYLLKRRVNNEEMWLNGIYTVHALQTALGNAFSKKKHKYLEKPLDIFEKTEAEKQQEIRQERQRLINFLSMLKKSTDVKGVGKDGKP